MEFGMCGGFSDLKEPDEKIRNICVQMKPEVEKKTGKNFKVFGVLQYRSQTVNRYNYLIKIDIGEEDQCLHFIVLEDRTGKYTLKGVMEAKMDDPLEP